MLKHNVFESVPITKLVDLLFVHLETATELTVSFTCDGNNYTFGTKSSPDVSSPGFLYFLNNHEFLASTDLIDYVYKILSETSSIDIVDFSGSPFDANEILSSYRV